MKITLKTLQLQEMVSKAIKGASNNKMIPITWLMSIELKNNKLILTTTDATNTLKIGAENIEGEDFYTVVQCDIFSKLVGKLTSDNVSLEVTEAGLEVVGNGRYTFEIPLDEEGNVIILKDKQTDWQLETVKTFDLNIIKTLLGVAKVSLAKTMEIPCLTGYYFGDRVFTTNGTKVCCYNKALFKEPVLLSSELVNLLEVINKESITIRQSDKYIEFSTEGVVIRGTKMTDSDLAEYPVDGLSNYILQEFPSSCKLSKVALSSILDRLILFVSVYDKNSIDLTFTETGIQINSKSLTGVEIIPYTSKENFKPFKCSVSVELLQPQVSAINTENIELYFGDTTAIKIVSGDVVQITALMEDEDA